MKAKKNQKGTRKKANSKRTKKRKKQILVVLVFAALILISLVSFRFFHPSPAPDFQLDTALHGTVRLSEMKGTNVVLVFFRSSS